ncbi:MAG: hypothetical protein CM15mP88_2640 [Pseudomonadota bacterium]|nr:MAG: hypothetical protein CM15mP88_2640 [Pseudomonadota bacterium]
MKRLNNDPNTEALEGPELRTIFLGLTNGKDESLDMPGSGKNPFKDKRVRQAFHHAININAIKRVVMRNAATPTGFDDRSRNQWFPKDMNNRVSMIQMLQKNYWRMQGYPNGFPVTFDCPMTGT